MPGRRTIYRLAEIKVFRSKYLHVSTLTPLFTCHIESPPSRLIFLDTNDIWRQECLERTSQLLLVHQIIHPVTRFRLDFYSLAPCALPLWPIANLTSNHVVLSRVEMTSCVPLLVRTFC